MNLKAQRESINSWLDLLPSTFSTVAPSFFKQVKSIPELEANTISDSTVSINCDDDDNVSLTFSESIEDITIILSPEQVECLYKASLAAAIQYNQIQKELMLGDATGLPYPVVHGQEFMDHSQQPTKEIKGMIDTINLYFKHLGYAPMDIHQSDLRFDIFNPSDEIEKISRVLDGFHRIGDEASPSNVPHIDSSADDGSRNPIFISINPLHALDSVKLKINSIGQLEDLERIACSGLKSLKVFYTQMNEKSIQLAHEKQASAATMLHQYDASIARLSSLSLSGQAKPASCKNEDDLRACLESLDLQTKKVITFPKKPGARYIEVEPAKRQEIAEALKQTFGKKNVRLAGDHEGKFIQVSGILLDLLERPHPASAAAAAGAGASG